MNEKQVSGEVSGTTHVGTYLDNAATTLLHPRVLEAMQPWLSAANPSSLHRAGDDAQRAVEHARATIAHSLNAQSREIIFTSGGTEANNLALKGYALANKHKGTHLITTAVEHKSVLNTMRWLESQGFTLTILPVNQDGRVTPEQLAAALTDDTILVSIIHANNEIGTLNDLPALAKVCKEHKVALHTDACQSYTKTELDVTWGLNLVTINSHKINGPKGVGALYVRNGTKLTPLLHGGEQEHRLRAGTENVAGIVGFATATTLPYPRARVAELRDWLRDQLLTIPDTCLNGPRDGRLCNNLNLSFTGVEGEAIVGRLDAHNIQCSTGSACSEASLEPSYVLKAIGCDDEEANGSLRLSLGRDTTREDVERVARILPTIIAELRALSPVKR